MGAVVGGHIGLGAGGKTGAIRGAKAGTEMSRDVDDERTYGLSQYDIDEIVDSFPNNNSAVFAIVEHLWAKDTKQAVVYSNGSVFIQGMLPPELFVSIGEALPKLVSR